MYDRSDKRMYWCGRCYRQNKIGTDECVYCGQRLTPYYDKDENSSLNSDGLAKLTGGTEPLNGGIYRTNANGYKQRISCLYCGSYDCSWYIQSEYIPGKTKTKVSLNLNPFKPFTLFDVKEKQIRADRIVEKSRVMCNKCGRTFG